MEKANKLIKIGTLKDFAEGKSINQTTKELVPNDFKGLETRITSSSEIEEIATEHHKSIINFAAKIEALELNQAKQNITGIDGDPLKWLKRWFITSRWFQLSRQRNYNITIEGINAVCLDVVSIDGKTKIVPKLARVVSTYLSNLYDADYNENYLLVEREEIKTPNGSSYQSFAEYDRGLGIVKYWAVPKGTDMKNIQLVRSTKKSMSELNGGVDIWEYKKELGIEFLPLFLTWNDEFGNPTLKYQFGAIKILEQFADDFMPTWIASRTMYNVNELYLKAQGDPAGTFAAQLRSKNRVRTTKTNSNKYVSEVGLLEGNLQQSDTLIRLYNKMRSQILEDALLDVSVEGVKQVNDAEHQQGQKYPKLAKMDKASLRGIDDTIGFDRLLIMASKLGLVKNYSYNSILVEYDLGYILTEREQYELNTKKTEDLNITNKQGGVK